MLPYIYIFGLQMSMYTVLYVSGFLVSAIVFFLLTYKKIKLEDYFLFIVAIFLGAVVGGKVLAFCLNIPQINSWNTFIFYLSHSGLVFYGGVIGAFISGMIYLKLYGLDPQFFLDRTCICLPIGHAIGRLGCFCAGCCYGKATDSIFGIVFSNAITDAPSYAVHPTQLYESVACLIIFIVLLTTYLCLSKNKANIKSSSIKIPQTNTHSQKPSANKNETLSKNDILKSESSSSSFKPFLFAFLYGNLYGIARFIIEFFRGDESRGILILSTSQYISIILIIFVNILFFTKLKNTKFFNLEKPKSKLFLERLEREKILEYQRISTNKKDKDI